jgi:hypothetical protein
MISKEIARRMEFFFDVVDLFPSMPVFAWEYCSL